MVVFLFRLLWLFLLLLCKNSLVSLLAMKNALKVFQKYTQVNSKRAPFLQMAACGLTQKRACERSLVIYAKTQHSTFIDFKDLGYFWLKKHFLFSLEKGVL